MPHAATRPATILWGVYWGRFMSRDGFDLELLINWPPQHPPSWLQCVEDTSFLGPAKKAVFLLDTGTPRPVESGLEGEQSVQALRFADALPALLTDCLRGLTGSCLMNTHQATSGMNSASDRSWYAPEGVSVTVR